MGFDSLTSVTSIGLCSVASPATVVLTLDNIRPQRGQARASGGSEPEQRGQTNNIDNSRIPLLKVYERADARLTDDCVIYTLSLS